MAKVKYLLCPYCGKEAVKASICRDLETTCPSCNASLIITKNDDGSCSISARPLIKKTDATHKN